MGDEKEKQDAKKGIGTEKKKPYTAPMLTMYGNVEQITQGGNSGPDDGLSGGEELS